MNSIERFYATIERKPVDRPACWLGMPTPSAVNPLCEYFGVKTLDELKASCGDDFYAIEVPYRSPTCSALYAAFDWYMNGSDVDSEHRTLTAEGFFSDFSSVEEAEASGFPWPDPELYIDPAECKRLVDEAPGGKVILGMVWAAHFQDFCAAFGMENAMMNMLTEPDLVHVAQYGYLIELLNKYFGLLIEMLCILARPPVGQVAILVVVAPLIVEAVEHLMAYNDPYRTIVYRIVGIGIEERGLKYPGGETDLVGGRVVVCIYSLWAHEPLGTVNGFARF